MPHKSDVQVALISGGQSGIGFASAILLVCSSSMGMYRRLKIVSVL